MYLQGAWMDTEVMVELQIFGTLTLFLLGACVMCSLAGTTLEVFALESTYVEAWHRDCTIRSGPLLGNLCVANREGTVERVSPWRLAGGSCASALQRIY